MNPRKDLALATLVAATSLAGVVWTVQHDGEDAIKHEQVSTAWDADPDSAEAEFEAAIDSLALQISDVMMEADAGNEVLLRWKTRHDSVGRVLAQKNPPADSMAVARSLEFYDRLDAVMDSIQRADARREFLLDSLRSVLRDRVQKEEARKKARGQRAEVHQPPSRRGNSLPGGFVSGLAIFRYLCYYIANVSKNKKAENH
jgi:hypothetical protein